MDAFKQILMVKVINERRKTEIVKLLLGVFPFFICVGFWHLLLTEKTDGAVSFSISEKSCVMCNTPTDNHSDDTLPVAESSSRFSVSVRLSLVECCESRN